MFACLFSLVIRITASMQMLRVPIAFKLNLSIISNTNNFTSFFYLLILYILMRVNITAGNWLIKSYCYNYYNHRYNCSTVNRS